MSIDGKLKPTEWVQALLEFAHINKVSGEHWTIMARTSLEMTRSVDADDARWELLGRMMVCYMQQRSGLGRELATAKLANEMIDPEALAPEFFRGADDDPLNLLGKNGG